MGFGRRAILVSEKGANSGVATLDASGDLASTQLPPTVVLTTGNQNVGGVKTFTDTTAYTAPGTGALVCQGGVSIAGSLGVAGTISGVNFYSDSAGITRVGIEGGYGNTGDRQTATGYAAGQSNTGDRQTATGYVAGQSNTGDRQTATGYLAGYDNTGDHQTVTGYAAGLSNTGINQTATGYAAGHSNTGNNTVFIGHEAGYQNTHDNYFAVKHSVANALPLITGFFDTRTVSFANFTFSPAAPPLSATATGIAGEVRKGSDYIYVCTATNTWKRAALSTW